MVLFANNLESQKVGMKGIIKVSNKFFQDDVISKIALVAPNATLITIRNYKVTEKRKVNIPDEIQNLVKCVNPNCITNAEDIHTRFHVRQHDPIQLTCHYCEKYTAEQSFQFI